MKIVINRCYGGFELSENAQELMRKKGCDTSKHWVERNNPILIEVVEELGAKVASGKHSKLAIVEIPNESTDYIIDEYDGFETVYYVVDGKIKQV